MDRKLVFLPSSVLDPVPAPAPAPESYWPADLAQFRPRSRGGADRPDRHGHNSMFWCGTEIVLQPATPLTPRLDGAGKVVTRLFFTAVHGMVWWRDRDGLATAADLVRIDGLQVYTKTTDTQTIYQVRGAFHLLTGTLLEFGLQQADDAQAIRFIDRTLPPAPWVVQIDQAAEPQEPQE